MKKRINNGPIYFRPFITLMTHLISSNVKISSPTSLNIQSRRKISYKYIFLLNTQAKSNFYCTLYRLSIKLVFHLPFHVQIQFYVIFLWLVLTIWLLGLFSILVLTPTPSSQTSFNRKLNLFNCWNEIRVKLKTFSLTIHSSIFFDWLSQ